MKIGLMQALLALIFATASLSVLPPPAAATPLQAPAEDQPRSQAEFKPAPEDDFSDADFAKADQPELGQKRGGDAVFVTTGSLLLVVLVVVLIVLIV